MEEASDAAETKLTASKDSMEDMLQKILRHKKPRHCRGFFVARLTYHKVYGLNSYLAAT